MHSDHLGPWDGFKVGHREIPLQQDIIAGDNGGGKALYEVGGGMYTVIVRDDHER